MENKDQVIRELQEKILLLESKVDYLQEILLDAKIPYEVSPNSETISRSVDEDINQGARIIKEEITKTHFRFFYSMFKGRMDVYSKRGSKPNPKTGQTGYYTQCWNFWKDGLCPKKNGKKIKCGECRNQNYKQLRGEVIMQHLIGAKEDCSDVIGLYPMMQDEICNFLVFDFDNHDDKSKVDDFANTDDECIDEVNWSKEYPNRN